jgi:hypothetical protein
MLQSHECTESGSGSAWRIALKEKQSASGGSSFLPRKERALFAPCHFHSPLPPSYQQNYFSENKNTTALKTQGVSQKKTLAREVTQGKEKLVSKKRLEWAI